MTPAAVVDLDRLESNLARWQTRCDELGLANRPHIKTHKCVEIAQRQVALGAAGVTCQTLHEAEVMVDAGIEDVLIPYNVVGGRKLEQLALLLPRAAVRATSSRSSTSTAPGPTPSTTGTPSTPARPPSTRSRSPSWRPWSAGATGARSSMPAARP